MPEQTTQGNMPGNRKCTTKEVKNKRAETDIYVCDRMARNQLKKIGFLCKKARAKPSLTTEQKTIRLQWAKGCTADDWMKVIFSEE